MKRRNVYEITVQAEDEGFGDQSKRYDTASVTIHVIDTNDNPPIFEHSPYLVQIIEHWFEPNTPVFTLKAKDADDPPYNEIVYAIRAGGQDDHHIKLNSSTGEIFLTAPLDREKTDTIAIEFIATDSGTPRLSSTGQLRIMVQDLNDNTPAFENSVYEFHVDEDAPVGFIVDTIYANDNDLGSNSEIRYSLKQSDKFGIDGFTGAILVKSTLDREEERTHKFMVFAKDRSPFIQLTSSAMVTIHIRDVNDNQPQIITSNIDFYVPSGLFAGDFIFGVDAIDKDIGENAKLRYSLSPSKDRKNFDINRNNGVILASSRYEEQSSFAITIEVRDSGAPNLKSQQRYNIYIAKDINVPAFDDDVTPKEVSIDEDLPRMSSVVTVKAYGIVGEEIRYAISGGNVAMVFGINHLTGDILVNGTLDFETLDRYELYVKAFYKTRPLYSVSKRVIININDKNDNPPSFDTTLLKVSITEGLYPPFEVVSDFFAVDADSGVNADITYRLLDEENTFSINQYTGLIKCNKELDRETIDRYLIRVEATDSGTPRLSSTATILLTVEDLNDNPPRFSRLYSVNVTENMPIGSHLLRVDTIDPDSVKNSNATYTLVNNPDKAFFISPTTGDISVLSTLDREIRDEYALKVQASDGAWKLETVITVTVEDANDNKPKFDHNLYEFTFPYSSLNKEGDVVGKVHALDRDSLGQNSALTYSFASVSDFFKIDEYSGIISTRKKLTYYSALNGYDNDNSYNIRVVAVDSGTPPMSSECQVSIFVVNGNSNEPQFNVTPEGQNLAVPFNIDIGNEILQLKAYDLDEEDKLEFSVIGGNGSSYFTLDPESGILAVKKLLVDIKFEMLSVSVMVQDNGTPMRSSNMKLSIEVTDENIFGPEFLASSTRIHIREDEAIGNSIINVPATDKDTGRNGILMYRIKNGDPDNNFLIDRFKGDITVQKKPGL